MRNNRYWTAIFAAIGNLRSAPADAQQDPGARGGADPSVSVIKAYDAAFDIPLVGAAFANRISYVISFRPREDSLRLLRFQRGETHREYAGHRQDMARRAQALSVRVS